MVDLLMWRGIGGGWGFWAIENEKYICFNFGLILL